MPLLDDIASAKKSALSEVADARTRADVEAVQAKWLGRKGAVRDFSSAIGKLSPEEKAQVGKALNDIKTAVTAAVEQRIAALGDAPPESLSTADATLPGVRPALGRLHIVYSTFVEIRRSFAKLGFEVAYGPEIETPYYNFEALNIPADHPARDAFDTFYIKGGGLLRSHTSPVQIHLMESRKPPIRAIVPGKCFRPDAADARHFPMFHQVEGLMVGEGVSMADLKGVLGIFARDLFGESVRMRFRPSFFPFVEPGAEADISCFICDGKGCSLCSHSGWIEVLGAGMVHAKVFEKVGYDPEKYTGFAVGMGVERVAMLRHRIPDIRLLTENNARFLSQF
jgi:phenylalanyl-tRNA synthetase alpha chain